MQRKTAQMPTPKKGMVIKMPQLNLTAENRQEELVKAYLEEHASETLAGKINNGTPFEKDGKTLTNRKTLSGFLKYACEEAKKQAEKGAVSACVEDAVVFGWAIHYFEEESIAETLYTEDGSEYRPAPKVRKPGPVSPPLAVSRPEPPGDVQQSIFDLMGQAEETREPSGYIVDKETGEVLSEPSPAESPYHPDALAFLNTLPENTFSFCKEMNR